MYNKLIEEPRAASNADAPIWQVLQAGFVFITVLLVAGLFAAPGVTLNVLWNVLIPLLPATFLITPIIWRSVCPLASLNMISNGLISRRTLPVTSLSQMGSTGILLLVLLVPARRFLLNENAVALAVVILLVVATALALGSVFDVRSGFCNAICPILPVEKLYGQHPLWQARNPRCKSCTLCTPKGCIDVAPKKSIMRAIGKSTNTHTWLTTPFGVFALAFPGFIAGYFNTADVSLFSAGAIYLQMAAWSAGSYLAVSIITRLLNVRASLMLPILAASAIGLYYWFVAPIMLSVFDLTGANVILLRVAILAFVGIWLGRAIHSVNLRPTS